MREIRFPSPRRYATHDDFFAAVYRWMCRVTARHLYYTYYKTGVVLPESEDLVDWLTDQSWPKVHSYVADYHDAPSRGMWTAETYERQLVRAVTFCLENHDPETIHVKRVLGGRKSKRQPVYTVDDLRAILAVNPESTFAEQKAALGCQDSKLYALRAEIKKQDDAAALAYMTHAHPLLDGN